MTLKRVAPKQFAEERTYSCDPCKREEDVNMVFREMRI